MARKIKELDAMKVKKLLSKGYKNSSVKEIMKNKYSVVLKSFDISQIKSLRAYRNVVPELNLEIIGHTRINFSESEIDKIKDIKWSIANGYSEVEIIEEYTITRRRFMDIRCLYGAFYIIGEEHNDDIEKLLKRKKTYITSKLVQSIKRDYTDCFGNVLMSELSEVHGLDDGAISRILNQKIYKNYGQKHNREIRLIKYKYDVIKKVKKLEKDHKNNKNEQIQSLYRERNLLNEKLQRLKSA